MILKPTIPILIAAYDDINTSVQEEGNDFN